MRCRRRFVAGAIAAVVAGGGAAASLYGGAPATRPATGDGSPAALSVDTTGFPSGKKHTGIFTDRCGFSHQAADDPILAPGEPGDAMEHDFFGNTATDAGSTTAKLVGGHTTCTTGADASAYWVPVLYQNGKQVHPSGAKIYWRQHSTRAPKVQPMPAGLTMIAGDESATTPQPQSVLHWSCKPGHGVRDKDQSTSPPDCTSGGVKLAIDFPSCWDGHYLDGASQTNVVYPNADGCPNSHPIEIPEVVFHTTYALHGSGGVTLSTMRSTSGSSAMMPSSNGSVYTAHADFMNGWTQSVLTADTKACIVTQTRCGAVTGPNATPQGDHTQHGGSSAASHHGRHH